MVSHVANLTSMIGIKQDSKKAMEEANGGALDDDITT
jgi:hypothetical protein